VRSILLSLGVAVGLTCLLSATVSIADEESVDLAKVPPAVLKAAEKAVPGGKLTKAAKETENGKTIYEIAGKDAKGRDVDVSVTAEAVVLEVETVIPMSEVPQVVTAALATQAKEIKVSKAETVMKEGKLTAYEFAGKNAKGENVEVEVSPDGKTVKVSKP
jgi:uncharacterized membrane protein YkoI